MTGEDVMAVLNDSRNSLSEHKEDSTRCGLGPFRPSWLQKLASKKSYVVIYGLIGMNMFAMGAYFVSTISTLEKRFMIPSKTTGIILGALDAGTLCSTLLLGYMGSRGHKIRIMAVGVFINSLACLVGLLPHLLYGAGQDALDLTLEYGATEYQRNTSKTTSNSPFTCGNATDVEEDCFEGSTSSVPVVFFFMTQFFMGVGCSGYFTLGMAYLDDNTRKDKAPILLAISQCIRMVGPTIGFSMGSYALSQYVDTSLHPIIDNKDPRWIGAWWMGWVPHGIIGLILGTLITLFPKQLPRTAQRKAEQALCSVGKEITTQVNRMSFKDFKITMGRLLRNKTLILNNLSSVFFILGYTGHWVFMPKYMETQYRQSASRASFISGSVGIIFMGLGLATSAVVISKFKPRARYLAAWCVFVEMIDVIGHFSWVFLSCNSQDLAGNLSEDRTWNLTTPCNTHCDCGPTVKYSPICAQDGGTTFYSPCHAGCTITDFINGTKMHSNCSCIPGGQAFDGPCPVDCYTNFTIFIVSQCIMRFLRSSGKAGNTLILFRCVDEKDKAFSISLGEFLLCGLALIPGPILYGLLLDSACIVWGQTCGNSGNCWLYDGQTQRYLLNFTAAGLLACGMLLDIGVWYLVKDLNIYDDYIEKPEVSADNEKLPVSPL